MSDDEQPGVVFPAGPDGRRSTAALGRAVVADALRPVDPAGALAAEQETNWRAGYLVHFRRLVEAGLASPAAAARPSPTAGLASLHDRMRVAGPDGEPALDEWLTAPRRPRAGHRRGPRRRASRSASCRCRTAGPAARRRAAAPARRAGWPPASSSRRAPRRCARCSANPDWLAAADERTVVVLGAGAEMGPLTALLRWGARVAGVDLPRPAALGAGAGHRPPRCRDRCCVPVDDAGRRAAPGRRAGADLLAEVPAVADWAAALAGAPGARQLRLRRRRRPTCGCRSAVDALTVRLRRRRPDLALALPRHADRRVRRARRGGRAVRRAPTPTARAAAKLLGRPLRTLSGRPAAAPRLRARAPTPGINDSLVAAAGAELRAGQAAAAVAGGGGAGRRGARCRSTSRRRRGPGRW